MKFYDPKKRSTLNEVVIYPRSLPEWDDTPSCRWT